MRLSYGGYFAQHRVDADKPARVTFLLSVANGQLEGSSEATYRNPKGGLNKSTHAAAK